MSVVVLSRVAGFLFLVLCKFCPCLWTICLSGSFVQVSGSFVSENVLSLAVRVLPRWEFCLR